MGHYIIVFATCENIGIVDGISLLSGIRPELQLWVIWDLRNLAAILFSRFRVR